MATVKVHWIRGSAQTGPTGTLLATEPDIAVEDVAPGVGSPAATGPAPAGAYVAAIETDARLRYTVRGSGGTSPDADGDGRPIAPASFGLADFIAVWPGATISFVEV